MKTRGKARWLLLDVGNSRLKWTVMDTAHRPHMQTQVPGRFSARGAIALARLRGSRGALTRLLRSAGQDAALYVCNVAGREFEQRLRAAASAADCARPRFARSAAAGAGVTNGYVEAWRLGVDRWVALIGAHHYYPGHDLCIVGIGSAMTIDLLAADGRHYGGCIVPGPDMMIDALLSQTAGIRRRAGAASASAVTRAPYLARVPPSRQTPFGRDTRAALLGGCLYACAALIERALREAAHRMGRRPQLLVTGGGAALITPLIRTRARRDADLVLRGLGVLAAQQRPR